MGLFQGSYRELTNARAVDVSLVNGNGDQLVGFDPSRPATSAITSVPASATSVVLLAANAARRRFVIQNVSNANLYVAFAATATVSAFTILLGKNGAYESPLNDYTGVISGIWASASGNAVITEITT